MHPHDEDRQARQIALAHAVDLEKCHGSAATYYGVNSAAEKFLEFLSSEPEASDDPTD